MKKLFFLLLNFYNMQSADLVVFSYNRPMQLYALLQSVEHYMCDVQSTFVVVRADSASFKKAYEIVQEKFPWAKLVWQDNPPNDFKNLVMDCAFSRNNSKYILFAVDDIIVKDFVNLNYCSYLLEKYQAYTLFLRLGNNINYCYSLNINTPSPLSKNVEDETYIYTFTSGKGDWAYPNNVDMNLYRKKDIYHILNNLDWKNPNQMEGVWASKADMNQKGIFFSLSKIINIPLNVVSEVKSNRNMHSYSDLELLEKFEQGLRINIEHFDKILNNSAHVEYDVYFKN